MHISRRRFIFTLFAIIYIVILPFLIIFSLGYDINFKTQSITNTLSIRLETVPRNANVPVNGTNYTTPTELRVKDGQNLSLKVESNDYLDEKFSFWSPGGENASVRIQNLWLLPKNKDQSIDYKSKKIVSLLDQNIALTMENQKYYIQDYSFGGLQGNSTEVTQKLDKGIETSNNWRESGDNVFFEPSQNLVLYKNGSSWNMLNFSDIGVDVLSLASYNDNEIFALDKNSDLWIFEKTKKILSFVGQGYHGLQYTKSPENIWLIDNNNQIYRLNRSTNNFNLTTIKSGLYLDANQIFPYLNYGDYDVKDKETWLGVKSLFLGLAFKIGNNLVYIQDSDKSSWQVLATNVDYLSASGSTVFWLDKSNNLFAYNLLYKNQKFLGQIDIGSTKNSVELFYYTRWRRIMIYSQDRVYSVWFESEFQNKSLNTYYPNNWIQNATCLPKIQENYQFCSQDNQFITFKNNSIPF